MLHCTGKNLNSIFGLAAKVTADLRKNHFSSEVGLEAREIMESRVGVGSVSSGMKKG